MAEPSKLERFLSAVTAYQRAGMPPEADGLFLERSTAIPTEQIAPSSGEERDRASGGLNGLLMNVTQNQILIVTAGIVGVLFVIYLMRR